MGVVVARRNGQNREKICSAERLPSRINRNKNRYEIIAFPCEQPNFAFKTLALE